MIGKDLRRDPQKKSSFFACNSYAISGGELVPEKVAYANCINCYSKDNLDNCAVEMTATAAMSRAKFPVKHFVLSWREGEQPSKEQVDEAVKISLEELGLTGHQCVYGLHQNTHNYHLHLSVNKVNPETFKSVDPNGGFTEKAMERAARRIEKAQGWEVEKNAWTTIDQDGIAKENGTELSREDKKIPAKVKDKENKYGEKSAIRIAQEQILPLVKSAETWEQLHSRIARVGAKYEVKGSGAIFIIGDTPIKASSVSKACTLKNLQKKLGEFTPPSENIIIKDVIKPEPLAEIKNNEAGENGWQKNTDWKAYEQDKKDYLQWKKKNREEMNKAIATKREEIKRNQKAERDELNKINWKHKGAQRNVMRSALAMKQAQEKAEQNEKVSILRKNFNAKFPAFPSFEMWLRMKQKNNEANFWRYRKEKYPVTIANEIRGYPEKFVAPTNKDIRAFQAVFSKNNSVVFYVEKNGGRNQAVAFTDTGKNIYMEKKDEKAILAALQLAQQKWGAVKISGTEDYINKCIELAVKSNIKISNPELQEKITKAKENEAKLRTQSAYQKELNAFAIYHKAVKADRYTVTATEYFEDGGRRGFMVNKKDGKPEGFSARDMEDKMQRFVNLENYGRNIYYTPISDDKYHLLVDDLTAESCAEMLADGFKPAVIIESSPGNYQAIFNTDKLGTEFDREIGNELVKELNKKYGDPKVSGEIHAHRAPAFENKKAKHKREDGSYPEVKIIEAKGGNCAKCSEKIQEIYEQILRREAEKPEIKIESKANADTAGAYLAHFENIMEMQKRQKIETKDIDASRIDAMICIRLRATGHSKEAVEEVCEKAAPQIRERLGSKGTHDWKNYAKRSADYAFGTKGSIQIDKYKHFVPKWREMENQKNKDSEIER